MPTSLPSHQVALADIEFEVLIDRLLREPDARINDRVKNIPEQGGDHGQDGYDEQDRHRHRIIAIAQAGSTGGPSPAS